MEQMDLIKKINKLVDKEKSAAFEQYRKGYDNGYETCKKHQVFFKESELLDKVIGMFDIFVDEYFQDSNFVGYDCVCSTELECKSDLKKAFADWIDCEFFNKV